MRQGQGESKSGPDKIGLAERRAKALELRKAGASYEQIADKLGYSNRGNAYRDVDREIKAITAEPAKQVLTLELERLDAMLMGLWSGARSGNQGAVDRVVRIMDRRARYLGLDATLGQMTDTSAVDGWLVHMTGGV